jgi:hypothetical protein
LKNLKPQEQRYDTNESHEAETAKLAEEHESNHKVSISHKKGLT